MNRRDVKDGRVSAAVALEWLRRQAYQRPAFLAWLKRRLGT